MRMLVRMVSSCMLFNLCGLVRWSRGFAAQSLQQKKSEYEIQGKPSIRSREYLERLVS
jgi:hypothetical protein